MDLNYAQNQTNNVIIGSNVVEHPPTIHGQRRIVIKPIIHNWSNGTIIYDHTDPSPRTMMSIASIYCKDCSHQCEFEKYRGGYSFDHEKCNCRLECETCQKCPICIKDTKNHRPQRWRLPKTIHQQLKQEVHHRQIKRLENFHPIIGNQPFLRDKVINYLYN